MKILCFGNEFLKGDSLAKELADEIKIPNVEFVKCTSPEEIFDYAKEKVLILDVAKNTKDVVFLENIEQLQKRKLSTLHDFDLGFFLQLMKKIDKKLKVAILCIPQNGNKKKIATKVEKILNEFRSL